MKCPLCGSAMKASIVVTGGCMGHPSDQRCYCPSQDVHVEFSCPTVSEYRWANKNFRGVYRKCNQPVIKPPELGDTDSIGRWFEAYYTNALRLFAAVTAEKE